MRQVGYFRWKLPPKSTMMIFAISSKHYGLEMVFFDENGIDIKNETINGYVLGNNNEFVEITTEIPKIINNSPYHHGKKELHNFLSDRSHFMFKGFGGKIKEYKHFEKEGTLKDILIPSTRIKNKGHVEGFLETNKSAIFKPLYSDKGKGIFILEKIADDLYLYKNKKETREIHKSDFFTFYKKIISQKGLLMSKFINSKTKSGHPFDIRINFEKDFNGEWVIAQKYARIGFNNEITSNLATGGGTSTLRSFLKTEFNLDERRNINATIKDISANTPEIVEKMTDFDFNSIGLDLGIDRNNNNKVHMFEINSYPGISIAVGQVALLRTGYMHYYLENKLEDEDTVELKKEHI